MIEYALRPLEWHNFPAQTSAHNLLVYSLMEACQLCPVNSTSRMNGRSFQIK